MGGSSGGGGSVRYDNLDKLYGAQADIATGVYDKIYAPYAPGAVADLNTLRQDAMSGRLGEMARTQAGSDVNVALGTSANDALRSLSSRGANFDPTTGRGADIAANLGLGAAKMRSGAMNQASQWAEGQKWGRNFDFYNALSGIPTQSTSALSGVTGGMSGNMNAARSANAQSSAGWGTGLAYMGSQLFKKDGGYIDGEVHAADGAYIRPESPRLQGRKDLWLPKAGGGYSGMTSGGYDDSGSGLGGIAPYAMLGAMVFNKEIKDGLKEWKAGLGTDKDTRKLLSGWEDDRATVDWGGADLGGTLQDAAGAFQDAASFTYDAIPSEIDTSAWAIPDGAGTASEAITSAFDPSTLADTAFFSNGGLAEKRYAMGGIATNMGGLQRKAIPEVGRMADPNVKVDTSMVPMGPQGGGEDGMSVGTALMLARIGAKLAGVPLPFASGGHVGLRQRKRKDMRPGGKVTGPGTETSDSIPARLSDGEYVLNAEAVKLIGKDKLEKINQAGLQRRRALKGK